MHYYQWDSLNKGSVLVKGEVRYKKKSKALLLKWYCFDVSMKFTHLQTWCSKGILSKVLALNKKPDSDIM